MLVYIKMYACSKVIWELQYSLLYLCRHGLFDNSILDLIDKYFVECGNILDQIFLFHTCECDLHISHLDFFFYLMKYHMVSCLKSITLKPSNLVWETLACDLLNRTLMTFFRLIHIVCEVEHCKQQRI